MLREVNLPKPFKSLKPFVWDSIPDFCVISGENGSGKTALLEIIESLQHGGRTASDAHSPQAAQIARKIKYVPANFNPGDISQNSENAQQNISARAQQVVDQIRSGARNTPVLEELYREVFSRFQRFAPTERSSEAEFRKLSDKDILDLLPTDFAVVMQDFANNEFIAEVFINYQNIMDRKKLELFDQSKLLQDDQIIDEIGSPPPWLVVNNLLEEYGFSYRINSPVRGMAYVPKFEDAENSASVPFAALSSGEKILVTLVLWAFNSRAKLHRSVYLLDEFDAHLNPALAKMMIEIIKDQLVGKFGLQVIMTTHSPSTVAHSPDNALFWMERGKPIRRVSKHEAISRLSSGFMTLQHDQASDIFQIIAHEENKPFLCVEGPTDTIILNEAWSKLRPSKKMPFIIRDLFDCWFLTNTFKRGLIFENYADQSFWGLLDYDSAFKDCRDKLRGKKEWSEDVDEETGQVFFLHKNDRGKLLTLPVPDHRSSYAGPKIRDSYLSIELLFDDEHICDFCDTETVAGGAQIFKFRDKHKMAFAKSVNRLPSSAFHAFESLFEKFEAWAS